MRFGLRSNEERERCTYTKERERERERVCVCVCGSCMRNEEPETYKSWNVCQSDLLC